MLKLPLYTSKSIKQTPLCFIFSLLIEAIIFRIIPLQACRKADLGIDGRTRGARDGSRSHCEQTNKQKELYNLLLEQGTAGEKKTNKKNVQA